MEPGPAVPAETETASLPSTVFATTWPLLQARRESYLKVRRAVKDKKMQVFFFSFFFFFLKKS